MDVPLREAIENQPEAQAVCAQGGALNDGGGLIDLGAAVGGLVNISVGLDLVRAWRFGGRSIERFGEGKFEPVRAGTHLLNFERSVAGPNQPLQGKRFPA